MACGLESGEAQAGASAAAGLAAQRRSHRHRGQGDGDGVQERALTRNKAHKKLNTNKQTYQDEMMNVESPSGARGPPAIELPREHVASANSWRAGGAHCRSQEIRSSIDAQDPRGSAYQGVLVAMATHVQQLKMHQPQLCAQHDGLQRRAA